MHCRRAAHRPRSRRQDRKSASGSVCVGNARDDLMLPRDVDEGYRPAFRRCPATPGPSGFCDRRSPRSRAGRTASTLGRGTQCARSCFHERGGDAEPGEALPSVPRAPRSDSLAAWTLSAGVDRSQIPGEPCVRRHTGPRRTHVRSPLVLSPLVLRERSAILMDTPRPRGLIEVGVVGFPADGDGDRVGDAPDHAGRGRTRLSVDGDIGLGVGEVTFDLVPDAVVDPLRSVDAVLGPAGELNAQSG